MSTAEPRAPRETAPLFGGIADLYDRFTQSLDSPESPVNHWVDKHLRGGRRAIDIGCGAGRYTTLLAERYGEVVGIDPAPGMIEIAGRDRSRPNISYQVRDAFDVTPEKDGLFDTVFAFSCVLHIGPPDLVLTHLRNLVAPGGVLLVFEPERPATWGGQDWQADLAFRTARAAYQSTGDVDDAVNALRLFLSPTWRQISEISVPLTREEFHREYAKALPGVVIEDGIYSLGSFAASWQAPKAD